MVVALKARNFALKPRTKFMLKFVRDLNAITNLIHFLTAAPIRYLSTRNTEDSGNWVQRDNSLRRSAARIFRPGLKYINRFEFRDFSAANEVKHHNSGLLVQPDNRIAPFQRGSHPFAAMC